MKATTMAAAALLAALAGAASADAPGRATVLAAHAREARAAGRLAPAADTSFARGRASASVPAANPRRGTGDTPLVVDEGFESVETFEQTGGSLQGGLFANGWLRQNNSDAPYLLWYKGNPAALSAYDGAPNSYLAQNWYATQSDTGTASAWVMSPPINFGSGATLSFYTRTAEDSTQADRLQVRVCTGPCTDVGALPEDVGGYTTLLLDINPGEAVGVYPESWTRYTLTATDGLPTSGSGRIAFRYYFHQADGVLRGNYVGIDRVTIDEGAAAAGPLDLAVTVSPADQGSAGACGSATSLDVATGDQVNVCYRLTNRTADTLRWHVLRDDVTGALLGEHAHDLAPGATWQVNRLITVGATQSASVTWQANRERPGYVADDTQPAQYLDVTDGTEIDPAEVFWGADLPFPADFDFRLYGERVHALCVMDYGFVVSRHYEFCPWGAQPNAALPDYDFTAQGSGMALYSANVLQGGRFYQKTIGTAPNRRYVIDYHDKPISSGAPDGGPGLTAQVVLHEGSDVIEFQYANTQFGGNAVVDWGGTATIGLQNRQIGQTYSHLQPSLQHVSRIVWTPSDPTTYSTTRKIHIAARAPVLRTSATSIAVAAPVHGSANATLTIANDGEGRLDWTTGEDTAATSHFPVKPRATTRRANTAVFDPVGNAAERKPGAEHSIAGAGKTELPLWTFEIANGYLLQTNAQTPGYDFNAGRIAGYPGARLVTGADFLDDDFSRLYAYDTSTHELLRYGPIASNALADETVLGTLGLPTGPFGHGLKQDPATGTVYLVTADGTESTLWTVDPSSLAVRQVGPITGMPGILAIAFDGDGRLYGVDGLLDILVAIDKKDGRAEEIGPLGIVTGASISALAFDGADGTLYFASFVGDHGAFYRIDTVTGAATLVTNLAGIDGSPAQFGTMAFTHRTARCTQPADVPWLSVAPGSGSIAAGGAPATLTLGFDGSALDEGTWRANLCVHSNDPYNRRRAVPVKFTVGRGDDIFADGFEAAVD